MFTISRRSLLSNGPSVVLATLMLGGTPVVVCAPGQMQAKSQPANPKASLSPAPAAGAKKNIPQKSKEKEKFPPPGPLEGATKTELHTVAPGESLPSLALHYLPQTCYMTEGRTRGGHPAGECRQDRKVSQARHPIDDSRHFRRTCSLSIRFPSPRISRLAGSISPATWREVTRAWI